ncbi:MAG: succinylglutamate desuccinylase/aspartoacylase family protein [Chloroflexota bacterium]|nr:succinylglutamate desuccinylase/aspartoacylase family protein [Chloroflexota bacterium]MCY3582947.1 succinylglutamate desuccinylase/aspartoacylase family protein [Chloroflexota bacterium]MDE2649663.1 succinylglutamate desuccinylase/aspartoacylase family protein [Chloroflexota bacterium]MXV91858.1 succinylglutamate desuccinylase/aspartoacylase family protein [Chloroflexota bacterium]MXX50383.1 succinylglutamate desuccinylase/aspartoacylase family protein [Chloroflexota bacterium]
MKLGNIEAAPGSKAYGRFQAGVTHGQFPAHIPLHIVNGAGDGPTLVVQAGASGLEIEPSLILPHVVKELAPAQVRGALILVPLMNTSGFEFTQVNSAWDDKHLNRLGRGDAQGSISQQMVHQYYQAAIAPADALLDIRSGSQWSYHHFAGVYSAGDEKKSCDLAVALGLPQVVLGLGADDSMAHAAAQDGLAVVAAHIGGGPGLRDYRERDLGRIRNAVLNAMRHLGMLAGELESDSDSVVVLRQHTVIMPTGARGFTFMDKSLRGKAVNAGEPLGYVRHPFSGERLETIRAPRGGIVVEGGAAWPVVPEDTMLAMLGDLVKEDALA